MRRAGLVALDLDDTLYLERDYVRSGLAAAGRWAEAELGLPGLGERAWADFEAGARGHLFDGALRALGHAPDPALVQRLVQVYRAHAPALTLLPDADALLRALAPHTPLAGITDGPLQSQQAKARALALERWLAPLVFTAAWGAEFGKPHPRAFRHVQQAHGVAPADCVYVADNPAKDFAAPRALGWRTVRVRRPRGLHAACASGADVDLELESLAGLPALLGLAPA